MLTVIWNFLSTEGFQPHGLCLLWRADILWAHIVSDIVIAASYFSIPVALIYLAIRRSDIGYHWVLYLFGAFIVACGTTHIFGIWTMWVPDYGVEAIVKVATALISITAAITLWPLMPKLIAIPSAQQLEAQNLNLSREISDRKFAEAELRKLNELLETKVAERTRELEEANSALRENEQRFRDFAEASGDWFWEMGPDLRFTNFWGDIEGRVGLSASEIVGRTRSELASRDAQPAMWAQHDQDLQNRRDFRRFIYAREDSRGNKLWLSTSGKALFDGNGTFLGYRGTGHDVTEQILKEDILKQAQKMEIVGQLTAGVAHDFNNLLGIIIGNAESLECGLDEENRNLEALKRAADRGSELTHRLLAFSRKQVLQPEIIHVNRVIEEIVELLSRTLEANITVETSIEPEVWNCEVDPSELNNALVNLGINARDAMPDGGTLRFETSNTWLDAGAIGTAPDLPAGNYVRISIRDTGDGIPEAVLPQVFEPFFTTKPVGEGSGLGLSMVYGFVKQSGGHITIDSEPDMGTTIEIYLPRSTKPLDRREAPTNPDAEPDGTELTVMVVEDNADFRELTVSMLDAMQFSVCEAENGADALQLLETRDGIDLLITDIVLPGGLNGPAIAAAFKRRFPEGAVVYMSGYTQDAFVQDGHIDADHEFLQKPFRRRDLIDAIARVVTKVPRRMSSAAGSAG